MLIVRSLIFNAVFYANMIAWMIVLAPSFAMPRAWFWAAARLWSRLNLRLLEALAGTTVEFRGLENLPPGGAIIASKHQSTFETLCLLHLFHDPAFILKRELMWIPVFGWYAAKAGMIPVDRARGREALKAMTARALGEMKKGRQIVIYPEGTRRPPGAEPAYKFGVAHLYRETGMPVVPVALNSGLFWPRRGFRKYPGRIVVEFLPAIAPGLAVAEVPAEIERRTEAATDRLLAEALSGPNPPPLPAATAARLAALRAA